MAESGGGDAKLRANVIDPLGGSYYVEALTNKMEEGCRDYFDKIEKLGGVLKSEFLAACRR